jgi:hypothetical protein
MRTGHWVGLSLAALGVSVGGWAWWRKRAASTALELQPSSAQVAPRKDEGTDTTTVVAKGLAAFGLQAPALTTGQRVAYAVSVPAGATVAEKARLAGF